MSLGYRNPPVRDKSAPELFLTLLAAASPALERLNISWIRITSEWLACDPFEKFTALRSLTIMAPGGCPIPSLVSGIGQLRTLESLHISRVNIGDSNSIMLAATLGDRLPLLAELEICSSGFREKAGRPIGSLIALGRVKKLILDCNRLEDDGISAMVDAIIDLSRMHRCKLQQLGLRMNNIGSAGGIKLAEQIAHSPHFRALDLSDNPMGESAADALFKAIRLRSHSLEGLDVSECELGPRGALPVLDALRAYPALRILRTSQGDEGDLGAHALAQFFLFSGRCRLTELQIESSGITETGALELARALVKAYTLKNLNMVGNSIGPRGAAAIFDALATASTRPMYLINFSCCEIGNDGASAAGRLISRRGCRNVLLDGNEMDATGAKVIMDSAATSTTCVIHFLNLSNNPIGDKGVKYVLDKITQTRRTLVCMLDITGINMGAEGAMAIERAVKEHSMPHWMPANKHCGNVEADRILEGVVKWERDSKPPMAAILKLFE